METMAGAGLTATSRPAPSSTLQGTEDAIVAPGPDHDRDVGILPALRGHSATCPSATPASTTIVAAR